MRNVDVPGLDDFNISGMAGRQGTRPVKNIWQQTARVVRGVHHDQNCCTKVGRESGTNLLQRFNAAGRGADHDQVAIRHVGLDVNGWNCRFLL